MSEYLSDQGKRTHLLDYLASMYESLFEVSESLITLEHGNLSDDEFNDFKYAAATGAMNMLADMRGLWPMLVDIYHDAGPVLPFEQGGSGVQSHASDPPTE